MSRRRPSRTARADRTVDRRGEPAVRLLIVEDDARMAALLKRALEEDGYAVDVSGDGQEALWLGRENDYDAIMLDAMLPGLDGFEIVRSLARGAAVGASVDGDGPGGSAGPDRGSGRGSGRLSGQAVQLRRVDRPNPSAWYAGGQWPGRRSWRPATCALTQVRGGLVEPGPRST